VNHDYYSSPFSANKSYPTASEGTLFRATSVACKIFNHFAKYIGMPYLWLHLAFFINQLHEFGKEERRDDRESILGPGTMEVDPDRDLDEDEAPIDEVDIRLNQYELLLRASKLLKSILKSPTELPPFVFSWAFASEIKASPITTTLT
jgi:hypothetical protein